MRSTGGPRSSPCADARDVRRVTTRDTDQPKTLVEAYRLLSPVPNCASAVRNVPLHTDQDGIGVEAFEIIGIGRYDPVPACAKKARQTGLATAVAHT